MSIIYAALREKLGSFGFNEEVLFKLEEYMRLLKDKAEQINLTTISDDSDIIVKHFLDSYMGAELLLSAKNVLDIGSGAGIPAIPLAILYPNISFTLIEATAKKTAFLQSIKEALLLKNVTVCTGRIEVLAKNPSFRDGFDAVTSRGLAPLNQLIELGVPFLKEKGVLIAYKAAKADEEIETAQNALKQLNALVKSKKTFMLDGLYQRCIIVIEKSGKPLNDYPRNYKKIKSKPL